MQLHLSIVLHFALFPNTAFIIVSRETVIDGEFENIV